MLFVIIRRIGRAAFILALSVPWLARWASGIAIALMAVIDQVIEES